MTDDVFAVVQLCTVEGSPENCKPREGWLADTMRSAVAEEIGVQSI